MYTELPSAFLYDPAAQLITQLAELLALAFVKHFVQKFEVVQV